MLYRDSVCTCVGARPACLLLILAATALPNHVAEAQLNTGAAQAQQLAAIPLAAHAQGQAMMQQAVSALLPDVNFTFLNKTYENDQYTRVLGERVRTACIRFRATSGLRFKMNPPQFALNTQGLTVTQTIPVIEANGLTARIQVGPCVDVTLGFGFKLSNVKLTYRARPTLSFENQVCRLHWNSDSDEVMVTIGDVNFVNVQNDLERLAKTAVEEGFNASLNTFLDAGLSAALRTAASSVCGSGSGARR